ncbi:ABC transporter permease [Mahella australiensis]|uniref:Binding-protein-dependent transport systems inner membrane component n=1 Tax=Mahella australiensis (strain DSM 15567 / CIP 107919 / 50-1 BON) TaxID=697281 RepID=F3ZZP7_MAHA5|nr:ABC transporter permease subunit [Mahella australiensis]AEE97894.1 binding-protein-dependent transport systems inner membrane component [Mahella australiensis 50-1 BON]
MLKRERFKRELPLYLMIMPALVILLIYSYGPMFGLVMAFQKFNPALGFFRSPWVGLDNFKYLFDLPDFPRVVWNTLYIALMKIIVETIAAILCALLLNEIKNKLFKRTIQTVIYFPYFLSWVVLGGILREILAREGLVNYFLSFLGIASKNWLGDPAIFPWILVFSETWQVTGFNTIVYLAAILNIDPTLYEAAAIDGAGRIKQIWHITLPGMKSTIILLLTLNLGYILNAGFEQILVLYNPVVYTTGDVIDTWVYRAGLQQAQYSLATAFGLFRSVVSFAAVSLSYYLAYKYADYKIF